MGAKVKFVNKRYNYGELIADVCVVSQRKFKAINCPIELNSNAIDEFLMIFLIASKASGISYFKKLEELNKKESPRLDIAVNFLKNIGIKVERKKDNIKIFGNPNLELNKNIHIKNFFKDHRIFMMSCIAALAFGGNWEIDDKDSINTSFPSFLKTINSLIK